MSNTVIYKLSLVEIEVSSPERTQSLGTFSTPEAALEAFDFHKKENEPNTILVLDSLVADKRGQFVVTSQGMCGHLQMSFHGPTVTAACPPTKKKNDKLPPIYKRLGTLVEELDVLGSSLDPIWVNNEETTPEELLASLGNDADIDLIPLEYFCRLGVRTKGTVRDLVSDRRKMP